MGKGQEGFLGDKDVPGLHRCGSLRLYVVIVLKFILQTYVFHSI